MLERINLISAIIGGVFGALVTSATAIIYIHDALDKINRHDTQLKAIYDAVNGVSPAPTERWGVWNGNGGVKCDAGSVMIGGAVNTKFEGFARCVRIVQ